MNRGYQQFLKTSKTEVPATADQLKSLQIVFRRIEGGLGLPSLYNESLGTVSESYQYDRVEDRDKAHSGSAEASLGSRREESGRSEERPSLGTASINEHP